MIGLAAWSKMPQNMLRTRECVLNLASVNEVAAVNRLALTTGSNPVLERKAQQGYRYVADKFAEAGLTPVESETVAPPRVRECPVQLEAAVIASHPMAEDDAKLRGYVICFELRVQRVHVEESILSHAAPNRVDPERWRPLIMSFQRFYGLGAELQSSRLAAIPEPSYRSPDVDYARTVGRAGFEGRSD